MARDMKKDEAILIITSHLAQCGMLMPIEWVQKNGDDSEFMQAYGMAMNALKNEPAHRNDNVRPMTNADRIRAMSDSELIKLLSDFSAFACIFPEKDCEEANCVDCVTKWLQQTGEDWEWQSKE